MEKDPLKILLKMIKKVIEYRKNKDWAIFLGYKIFS